jgi:hypothetical protein
VPLFTYEIGRILAPVQIRIESAASAQPVARRATASIIIRSERF